jgi:adenylate kinase
MDLIFFGMQGSGKGTLGKAVAEKYGMKIFETGGELRKLSSEDTELGKKIKSIIEAGKLVSNEVVMEIVENFLNTLKDDSPILFDGIPRKVDQAKSLNALLDKHNRVYKGLLLKIEESTALKRLTTRRVCKDCKAVYPVFYTKDNCECGGELITRSDDTPDSIKTRLQAFREETIPAIELYQDILITIDGEPSIEEVEKEAFKVLDTVMSN